MHPQTIEATAEAATVETIERKTTAIEAAGAAGAAEAERTIEANLQITIIQRHLTTITVHPHLNQPPRAMVVRPHRPLLAMERPLVIITERHLVITMALQPRQAMVHQITMIVCLLMAKSNQLPIND